MANNKHHETNGSSFFFFLDDFCTVGDTIVTLLAATTARNNGVGNCSARFIIVKHEVLYGTCRNRAIYSLYLATER